MLSENLAKLRQGLFAAVFFVAGDEHDVFSFAGAVSTFVDDPRIGGEDGEREEKESGGEKSFHGMSTS